MCRNMDMSKVVERSIVVKKVNIIEKFNTSLGMIFVVTGAQYSVGDVVVDEKNEIYKIEKIIMNTRPAKCDAVSLVVTKCSCI